MCPASVFIMSRQFFCAIFCFLLIGLNAQENNSSNENASSRWLDKQTIADGKIIEWDLADLIYDPKAGFSYIIANDTSVLYIGLIIKDDINKAKFLNAGFSVFLNSEGKKKKTYAIDFPLPDPDHSIADYPESLRDLKSLMLINFLHARKYQLSGFKQGSGVYTIENSNDAGIKVSLDLTDSGTLIYETIIPFASILKKQPALQTHEENTLAICFSFNAATKPVSLPAQYTTSGVSGNPQSAGRRFANSNTPAIPPPSSGQLEKLFQSSKTWKVISLAKKP